MSVAVAPEFNAVRYGSSDAGAFHCGLSGIVTGNSLPVRFGGELGLGSSRIALRVL